MQIMDRESKGKGKQGNIVISILSVISMLGNRDNEKKEKKEKRVQARTSYRTLGAAVPDSVSHRNRRICFQGWVLCRRGR